MAFSIGQEHHRTVADKERESDVHQDGRESESLIRRKFMKIPPKQDKITELHDGDYTMPIERCEERVPHSGDGNQLFVQMRSSGPDAIGAVVFDHITVESSSRGAVYYGALKLNQLLSAVGLDGCTEFEPSDLIGKIVRVTIRLKHTDKWGWQPEVIAYSKAEETPASDSESDTDESEADDAESDPESIPF